MKQDGDPATSLKVPFGHWLHDMEAVRLLNELVTQTHDEVGWGTDSRLGVADHDGI